MNPCGKILLLLVVGCFGQNAPIITSSFSGEASQTIFDTSADVSVQCNPNHMCVSIDENYFITNRGHPVSSFHVKIFIFRRRKYFFCKFVLIII